MSKKKHNKFRKPAIICPFCIQDEEVRQLKTDPGRLTFCKRYFGEKFYPIVRDGIGIRPDKSQLLNESNECHYIVGCTRCKFQTFCETEPEAYEAMKELAGWGPQPQEQKPEPDAYERAQLSLEKEIRGVHSNLPIISTPPKKKGEKVVLCLIRKERPREMPKMPDENGILLSDS